MGRAPDEDGGVQGKDGFRGCRRPLWRGQSHKTLWPRDLHLMSFNFTANFSGL
jgi:hypothetical protein